MREQSLGIIGRLKEPWNTFALLIALLGRRSEEAAPLQPHDLDGRIIYKRRVLELKTDEQIHLPLDPDDYWHAELIRQLRKLGEGKKWIFQSRAGTPADHNNARRRLPKEVNLRSDVDLFGPVGFPPEFFEPIVTVQARVTCVARF
jgi:integrase